MKRVRRKAHKQDTDKKQKDPILQGWAGKPPVPTSKEKDGGRNAPRLIEVPFKEQMLLCFCFFREWPTHLGTGKQAGPAFVKVEPERTTLTVEGAC